MTVRVEIERPAGPEIEALIEERMAHSRAILPSKSIHTLDLAQLDRPNIIFWTIRINGALAGCGALKCEDDNGEIKSMFVRPAWRGQGLSRRVLAAIEEKARKIGLVRLNLETGTDSLAARALYENFGYAYRNPFGQYQPDPLSVFMTKSLV
ncbi:GNAT family N-acetyltransferase [Rhizobium hainanense]|uniref:Putative acetyltransferase n=1 Tax=Rhizobium hainanense TaxID=52131 RepID=A0A1C3WLB1_9HYPH|nr:GNAT family N-acetyltransferase [Rhizobium hainanense]SCB40705.1 putative acetyltransferase [Rhizobium hainanense]